MVDMTALSPALWVHDKPGQVIMNISTKFLTAWPSTNGGGKYLMGHLSANPWNRNKNAQPYLQYLVNIIYTQTKICPRPLAEFSLFYRCTRASFHSYTNFLKSPLINFHVQFRSRTHNSGSIRPDTRLSSPSSPSSELRTKHTGNVYFTTEKNCNSWHSMKNQKIHMITGSERERQIVIRKKCADNLD